MDERSVVVHVTDNTVDEWIVQLVYEGRWHQVAFEHHVTAGMMDVLIDHFGVSIDHSNKAFIGADVANHEWVFHFFDFGVFVANSLPEGLEFGTEQHMLD